MKKMMMIMAALLMVCCLSGAMAEGGSFRFPGFPEMFPQYVWGYTVAEDVWAVAADKLATRCGPSTEYFELGTYKMKNKQVRLLSVAYDENGVAWIQCEVTYGGLKRRVYTGAKRFKASTLHLELLPEETDEGRLAIMNRDSTGRYGPGSRYGVWKNMTVEVGTEVLVLTVEDGWAQIQVQTEEMDHVLRIWVEESSFGYLNG